MTVSAPTFPDLDQLIRDGAIRLEITSGVPTWEALPTPRHQRMIDRIRASIQPIANSGEDCDCVHLADVQIHFKDGSFKRPDIAIFCTDPSEEDESIQQVPAAVIEIISLGYEYKDLYLNPQFYLAQGCGDVVIVDPRSSAVTHYRTTGVANHRAPVALVFLCGCHCTIPEVRQNRMSHE